MLVAKVSKDVSRFRKDLEVVEDALEESRELTDVCRVCLDVAIRGCFQSSPSSPLRLLVLYSQIPGDRDAETC